MPLAGPGCKGYKACAEMLFCPPKGGLEAQKGFRGQADQGGPWLRVPEVQGTPEAREIDEGQSQAGENGEAFCRKVRGMRGEVVRISGQNPNNLSEGMD